MFLLRLVIFLILILLSFAGHATNLNVEITGVKGDLLTNTQAFLDIYKESQNKTPVSRLRIQQLHEKATGQIKRALQPFGYYRVKVQKELTLVDGVWQANYKISPGPEIHIKEISIVLTGVGKQNRKFSQLIESFSLKSGSVLLHASYENMKRDLRTLSLANGYLDASFVKSEVKVDLENYDAKVLLEFDTGPQYLFGTVSYVQQDEKLDINFLQRYIPFKTGDPYSSDALLELQTSLSDSDYFSRIEIIQLFEEARDLKVPLVIRVTPRKPRKYKFGLGYGTDTGARASAEHQRRVSPKGHVLTLKGKTSQRLNRVDMQYLMPLKRPASEQFTMNTHYLEQQTESRFTQASALDFRRTTGVGKWRQAVALTYEHEAYEVSDETGRSQLLMPNVDVIRSVYNNRLYPTKGSRITAALWLSHTIWYSDVNFLQLRLNGKWIFPVSQNGRLFIRVDSGATIVKSIEELPASKRFYAGGDQSIRGYGYEELGPLDDQGDTLGGKYLGVLSAEYEYRFLENWGAAIFYDAGNGFNDFHEKIYRGVGTGIRWRSIVGPIRLDLGWPLDKKVDYPRIHLVIGLDL